MATLKNTTIDASTSLNLPAGNTASRPASPTQGMIRYNTDLNEVEYYNGVDWQSIMDSLPKAKGGIWFDIEEGGVPYRVHVYNGRGFAYTSRNSAATLGFNDTENLIQDQVRGEVDALPGGCSGAITFEQALAWVHDDGARLITRYEYYNRVAEGTGCGYDSQQCWTCDKADQDGNRHWTHIGDWNSAGWSYNDEDNTSGHELRYGADVNPDRDDPVFLNDKFMFDWLQSNYPNDFTGDKFVLEQGGEVEYLIVAGGGGGGPTDGAGAAGGGGGAGGLIQGKTVLNPGTYPIVVGEGGDAFRSAGEVGVNGGNSSAFGLTAIGGAGGGSRDFDGRSGGSGSGDNRNHPNLTGTAVAGQGFQGGGGNNNVSPSAGGGGGGAGGPGEITTTDGNGGHYYAGKGGPGRFSSIAGTPTFYAGGGGGGNGWDDLTGRTSGQGGVGGGGAGGNTVSRSASTSRGLRGFDAGNFTGGGGGGSAGEIADGGRGGDGIVIIKYKRDYAYSNPSNSITTKNLFFNLDCARTGSFTGPRKDHDFWYDLQQGIRGTINGDIQLEAPDSLQASPQFDGNNKYVRFNFNQRFQLWGLEAWARFDYAVPNNDTAIGGPTTYQTLIGYNGNQQIVSFGAWTGSATNEAVHIWNGALMTYNRDYMSPGWHHLFFRWNGNTYDIFIDGFKTQTYARTSGHATILEGINYIDVGGNISAVYMFQGKIPVVRIYNGEISEEEVYKNFNALRWRYDV